MAKADPFEAVRNFERELCEYTGAPYAVAVNSCCAAILLSCSYVWAQMRPIIPLFEIPKLTYVGVPMAIANARCGVIFRDEDWQGEYEIVDATTGGEDGPHIARIYDSARRFTKDMFKSRRFTTIATDEPYAGGIGSGGISYRDNVVEYPGGDRFHCVSFHASKILNHSQSGAILHNSPEADEYLRRARFDGRREGVHPKDDTFDILGHHVYLSPDVAAALRWKLSVLPEHNADLRRSDYSDLSLAPIFGGAEG